MEKTKYKKLFKSVLKWSVTSLIVVGATVGATLGIISYNKAENTTTANQFLNTYEIQLMVNWDDTEGNINDVALSMNSRMQYFTYFDAEISTIGNDYLSITFPLNSLDGQDLFAPEVEQDLYGEVIDLLVATISHSNVEFRTITGEQLFSLDSAGQVRFQEPAPPATSSTYDTINNGVDAEFIVSPLPGYDIKLFDEARVSYDSGAPYVEVLPATQNISSEMTKMGNTLPGLYDETTNPNGNVVSVWFGYDSFIEIVEYSDPEGWAAAGYDALTYIYTDEFGNQTTTQKAISKPFFITNWQVTTPFPIFETWVPIQVDFTAQQAIFLADEITSNEKGWTLDLVDTTLILNAQSQLSLSWISWLFLTIIILFAFFMMYYFGLLAVIASTSTMILAIILSALTAIFALPVSSVFIFSFFVAIFISQLFTFIALREIKKDKLTVRKWNVKWFDYNKSISKGTTFPFMTIIGFALILSFMLAPIYQVIAYILLIGIVLSFLMNFIYVIPLMVGIDALFEFSKSTPEKWNFIIGTTRKSDQKRDNSFSNSKKHSNSKNIKIYASFVFALAIVSFGIFGIVAITTDIPTSFSNMDYYQYNIVRTVAISEDDYIIPPDGQPIDSADPYRQQEMIDQINNTEMSVILNELSNQNVNVSKTEIVRQDQRYVYRDLDPFDNTDTTEEEYSFSYGIQISSTTQLTTEEIRDLNVALGQLVGIDNQYTMTPTLSALMPTASIVSPFTVNVDFSVLILAMVIGFAATIIIYTLQYRWNNSLTLLSSLGLEMTVAFSTLALLFTPFNPIMFLVLILLLITSITTKSVVQNKLRERTKSYKTDIKIIESEYYEYSQKTIWPIIAIAVASSLLLIPIVVLTPATWVMVYPVLLVGFTAIIVSNLFVFPYVGTKLTKYRNERTQKRIEKDILESKNKDKSKVEEEYIEGINL